MQYVKLFIGTSKYESTSLLCTLFDVQCCQSVIRNMVYMFRCRLDSSVNHNLNDILTSTYDSFQGSVNTATSCEHLTETTVYIFLIYTALGQNCLHNVIIWTSESHVLAVCGRHTVLPPCGQQRKGMQKQLAPPSDYHSSYIFTSRTKKPTCLVLSKLLYIKQWHQQFCSSLIQVLWQSKLNYFHTVQLPTW